MPSIRTTATQFDVRKLTEPDEFWQRTERMLQQAADQDSQLIVFPEYFTVPWLLSHANLDFEKALVKFDDLKGEFHDRFAEYSKRYQTIIVAGSAPMQLRVRRVNRSFTYFPDGRRTEQDKWHVNRAEGEQWKISTGRHFINFWEWRGAGLGVAIGYDIEFPHYAEDLTEQDDDVILVPACTRFKNGYWRIHHCSQARAVENQSYVVVSCLIGHDPDHPQLQNLDGRAGFFSPCDKEFPDDGILKLGEFGQESIITYNLDIRLLQQVRVDGTALNRRDIL
ncbi:MAG: nitrilase-related carbon-nitrogen hydrolase [Bdellovibrionales bacterium]